MQQVDNAVRELLYQEGDLTPKEFAARARRAASKIRKAVDHYLKESPPHPAWRWAVVVAAALEGYADALETIE